MRLSELQDKDVLNIIDGKNIGKIIDIKIDENGAATGIIVEKHKFIISYFSNKKEITIKWNQIEKIGEDVIFLNFAF